MKFILYICITLFFTQKINGQELNDFYKKISVANSKANNGQLDSALIVYDIAFKEVNYIHNKFLRKALYVSLKKGDTLRSNKYSSILENNKKGVNENLIKIIDSLMVEDQRVRKGKYNRALNYYYKCIKNGKRTKKFYRSEKLRAEMQYTDSLNISYLLSLFEDYGFIGEKLVGESKTHFIHILLLHFDKDKDNLVLEPILTKALNTGKVLPLRYAQVIDRHKLNKSGLQTFYTWSMISKTKLDLSREKILEARESIGLYDTKIGQIYKNKYWILKNEFQ